MRGEIKDFEHIKERKIQVGNTIYKQRRISIENNGIRYEKAKLFTYIR